MIWLWNVNKGSDNGWGWGIGGKNLSKIINDCVDERKINFNVSDLVWLTDVLDREWKSFFTKVDAD